MRRRTTITVNKCKMCKVRIPLEKEYCKNCGGFDLMYIKPKLLLHPSEWRRYFQEDKE